MGQHWRSMMDPGEYVAAWDLPKEATVEIASVRAVKLPGTGDIKASTKPVLSFRGKSKKLIVNATIGKVIASIYGNDVEQWVGKKLTLYATTTKAKSGAVVDCVRVRNTIPSGPGRELDENRPVDEAMRDRQKRGAGELPADPPDSPRGREPGEEG